MVAEASEYCDSRANRLCVAWGQGRLRGGGGSVVTPGPACPLQQHKVWAWRAGQGDATVTRTPGPQMRLDTNMVEAEGDMVMCPNT